LRDPEPQVARVIPFVPRTGVVRAMPLPVQTEPRFARPATGPAAYASGADGPFSLPPAQPPPPSGFRRSASGFEAGEREAPAPRAPLFGGGGGSGGPGQVLAAGRERLHALRTRLGSGWSVRRAVKYIFFGIAGLLLAYMAAVVALAIAYRWINPPMSTLMLSQRLSGTEISQVWTHIDRISPNLLQAVILSEDGQFCRHRGVDWLAMKEAIEQSLDGNARGGSTISMQTVKNLFLWPSKSYVRKAIELPLAMGTEVLWSKQRMLEIYLNIAEWGPGIFGAEAAARYHFGKSAAFLTAREASLLAVALPNPIERQAGQPSMGQQRLAERVQARMRRVPNAASCAIGGRGNRAAPGDPAGQRRNLPL
jgi:monofunctional biosynthetic peptidoglycan transglycosylase